MSEDKVKSFDELLDKISNEHVEKKLRNSLYTYGDMLEAYWAGKGGWPEMNNNTEPSGDAPDFASFIRKHTLTESQNEEE